MSKSLVPLVKSAFLPSGGLKVLDLHFLESHEEWAKKQSARLRHVRQVLPYVLQLIPLISRKQLVAFLQELLNLGRIKKDDIISLYLLQTEEVRMNQPFLLLSDLEGFRQVGDPYFTFSEILGIANSVKTVSTQDIDSFFSEKQRADQIPVELVSLWASEGCHSMLAKARIAQYLFNRDPKSFDGERLRGLLGAASRDPHSGAVQIYIGLMYEIEAKRKGAKKDAGREVFADTIVKMISPLLRNQPVAFHPARKLLGWYLTNPFTTQEDKDWVEEELKIHLKAITGLYGNFIIDAKNDSAFSEK